MPGLFDGIRNSVKGVLTHRAMMEVVGNNISNAANEDYTRQVTRLNTVGSQEHGGLFFGQGVEVGDILRVRDELLEGQLIESESSAKGYETQLSWLDRVEGIFNEPSENGLNQALTDFWESWSELSTDPENFAARSNVMSKTENLAELIGDLDSRLEDFSTQIDNEILQSLDIINGLADEVASLNEKIFLLEAGRSSQANDLRDRRDGAIRDIAALLDVTKKTADNGMINLFVGNHALVWHDNAEGLVTRTNPLDASEQQIVWEFGDTSFESSGGEINGLLEVRDTIIGGKLEALDTFTGILIEQVNSIYANGVSLESKTLMESRLGFDSLGVTDTTSSLSLLSTGETGAVHFSFYDSDGDIVRQAGIVIDDDDSLDDIVTKINAFGGLTASLVSDSDTSGKLRIEMDTVSGANILGETTFAISDNRGGYDSSGFLNLLEFDQTDKSTNTSAAAPTLTSRDLSELQTILGEANLADVMSHVLNLSGTFTINTFETQNETTGFTDGYHMQQFSIDVVSTDTINSIMTKINNLTASYGMAITLNASDQLELTTTAQSDADGNIVLTGGTDYLRLSFANSYESPTVPADTEPSLFNGLGDNTGLFSTMQMNTLFMGSDASDIALDDLIDTADKINAGYKFEPGNNAMALDIAALQHSRVASSNQFTINEEYQNIVSTLGADIQQVENLANNENALLQSFLKAKDEISGVNLDEELANMIIYQRSYEASARMISTFDQMMQELIGI